MTCGNRESLRGGLSRIVFVLTVAAQAVLGAEIRVDLSDWSCSGDEPALRDGWELRGLGRLADGSVRFDAVADCALSPVFDSPIVRIVAVTRCSPTASRQLVFSPVAQEGAAGESWRLEATTDDYVEQSREWGPEDRVMQVRIELQGKGSTSWRLKELAIFTAGDSPRPNRPTELHETAVYRNAFEAAWTGDPSATRHELALFREVVRPASFAERAAVDFSCLTNATGKYRDIGAAELPGIEATNVLVPPRTEGVVTLGNTENLGRLVWWPDVAASGLTGLVRLWKHPNESAARTVTASAISGGQTNALAAFVVSTEPTIHVLAVPSLARDAAIELRPSAKARIYLDLLAIGTDYVPGLVATNPVRTIAGILRANKVVRGLEPGAWLWSARSFAGDGAASAPSALRRVELDAALPVLAPNGLGVILR